MALDVPVSDDRGNFIVATYHPPSAGLGQPNLTTADCIAQSLAVGPIFCASLIGVLVAPAAGVAAPLSMLLAVLGMVAMGWVIALFARRYAGAGSLYLFIQQAAGPRIGLFAAGVYYISALFLGGPTLCIILGMNASALLATLGVAVPWWLVAVAVAIGIASVNYVGIQITTRTQLTLTLVSALPLLITALAIAATGGDGGHSAAPFSMAASTPMGLLFGMFFATALFSGIESSAALGEETVSPHRTIPRAVIGSILITGAFYLVITYTSAIGFGLDHADAWAADPLPLHTLAARYVGSAMPIWVDVAIILDLVAMASAFVALTSRGFYALARDGLLPAAFGRVSRRHKTPVGGNVGITAFTLAAIAAAALTNTDPLNALYIGAGAGGLLLQATYVMLVLAAIRFVRQPGPAWRWPVLLAALATPVVGIYGALSSAAGPTLLGVYGAVAGLVVALIWTGVLVVGYPQRLAQDAAERSTL
jgi:amino acid transporter